MQAERIGHSGWMKVFQGLWARISWKQIEVTLGIGMKRAGGIEESKKEVIFERDCRVPSLFRVINELN